MDRRRLIAIAALLIVAFGIFFWWYLTAHRVATPASTSYDASGAPSNNGGSTIPSSGGNTPTPVPAKTSVDTSATQTITRLSRLFVERFGTFTSQGNFQDMNELVAVVTPSFRQWMQQTYIPSLQTKYPASTYAAQTTQVLGVTIEKSSDQNASVLVRTQQELTVGDAAPVSNNQSIRLTLVKDQTGWLVDSAVWLSGTP